MISAIHLRPDIWGDTTEVFDPRRWDVSNADSFLACNDGVSGLASVGLESNSFHRPGVRGAFAGFSLGTRACVGRRFAMIEFAAVLARTLQKHAVRLALKPGETMEDARKRAESSLERSFVALTLLPAETVPCVLTRRK